MSQIDIEKLAKELYGPDVSVLSQELGTNVVQAGVVHPSGIPLVVVTASSPEVAFKGIAAALNAVKAG